MGKPIRTDGTLLTIKDDAIPENQVSKDMGYYSRQAIEDNTRIAYQKDVNSFIEWGGLLPATPRDIVLYLNAKSAVNNPSTLSRRLVGISQWHVLQGMPDPTKHEMVKKTLKGIKKVKGQPPKKAKPLTIDLVEQMVDLLTRNPNLKNIRDIAILRIGFYGALRRSEFAKITLEEITWEKEGISILLSGTKTDTERVGETVAIPYAKEESKCPVRALKRWIKEANIQSGVVFRGIDRWGKIDDVPLSGEGINYLLKQLTKEANLVDAFKFSGHSLRHGFGRTASQLRIPHNLRKKQGRWKSDAMIYRYDQEGLLFEENAADLIMNNE